MLYGCETWSLILRDECRLTVFENRILRRIFGSNRDENGEWRRLHNEELYSLYRSPNVVRVIKSRRLRWAGHIARMEEGRSAFNILTGKPCLTTDHEVAGSIPGTSTNFKCGLGLERGPPSLVRTIG